MTTSDPKKVIQASRLVKATPQQIFDLLADPRKHSLIDGSGSVQNARVNAPERLSLGAKFGMDMKIGLPYRITNEVVEFDEPKQIGWRHMGGHIWRYVLEPANGGTMVTEQFDWTHSKSPIVLKLMGAFDKNKKSIEMTLERLAAHYES
ncbi:MAG: SRPBCC family protein [Actinomycetota bacterium]|nr:SRPBCC family protein [Actinomycetota bacterium]MDA3011570.1 SRPBCC family protein [Actinomycetota bacterium]MDA3024875.1 SRPBCC family protein [Actinomycetota bacterium]